MLIHCAAPPWHLSADMPTTQRIGFGFCGGLESPAAGVVSEDRVQQRSVGATELAGCEWVEHHSFREFFLADSMTGTGKGEWEHPHPLARHFDSEPQQHTR
jgi:hypothetical protein